jgi:hypothetical protein
MKKSKLLLAIGIILLSLVLAVIGWIVLPDTLVLQVTMSGAAGTTLPKPAGLAIPLLVSSVFAVLYYLREDKKNLLISVIGLAIYIPTFLMN